MLSGVLEEEALRLASLLIDSCGLKDALKASLGLRPSSRIGIISRIRRKRCKPIRPLYRGGEDEGVEVPFLGGKIELRGGKGWAYPLTYPAGLQPASIILSLQLKGIYPTEYSDQGDLIWRSIDLRYHKAMDILAEYDIEEDRESLALESAVRSTKLWPLMAMAMGEDVTEAYAHHGGTLYLDHVTLGRFPVANYTLTMDEIEKLATFVEADMNSGIDFSRPLNEVDLRLGEYNFRLALDLPPASLGAVDIRNLSALARLPLPRLFQLGTLSGYEAAQIIDHIMEGEPVLIFGRTGVGKTTLCNALMAALPRSLRIVSVEETREVEDLTRYGVHHAAYEVSGKLDFIHFLLHRNPDLVFLGEIMNANSAEAFVMASLSGIKALATTHARDFRRLASKWASWGIELPEGTLAVRMEDRRVAELRQWMGDGWDEARSPEVKWMDYVSRLEGTTNEEVAAFLLSLYP